MNTFDSSILALPEVKEMLEAAAAAGEGYANWKLGISYLDGRFGEYSAVKAAENLKIACDKGIYFAPHCMANLLEEQSIDKDQFATREYYLRLGATLGHAASQLDLAKYIMFRANGDCGKLMEARHWFQIADWNGQLEGRGYCAYIDVMAGPASPSSGESASRLLTEARAGRPGAGRAYAIFFSSIRVSKTPSSLDIEMLKEAVSFGDKEAACELFDLRLEGKISESDLEPIIGDLIRELLNEKNPRACWLQARSLLQKPEVEPINRQIARHLLESASNAGYIPAKIDLAEALFHEGGEKNLVEALILLEDAAINGLTQLVESKIALVAKVLFDITRDASSYYPRIRLGALDDADHAFWMAHYYSGEMGFSRDPVKLQFWLHTAINEGMAFAAFALGQELLSSHSDIPKNMPLALKFYEYAAKNGMSFACAALGDYFSSKGSRKIQNPKVAFHWYSKGAQLGYAYCMGQLVFCFANGYGTAIDLKEVHRWEDTLASTRNDEPHQPNEAKIHEKIAVEQSLAKVIDIQTRTIKVVAQ